jgi:hypothetical protein
MERAVKPILPGRIVNSPFIIATIVTALCAVNPIGLPTVGLSSRQDREP